jgi:hypothetical protein
MDNGHLVVAMRFLQESQIPLEPVFAFKTLNLSLHDGDVGREFEVGVIVEMDIVVGFALDQLDALCIERRS